MNFTPDMLTELDRQLAYKHAVNSQWIAPDTPMEFVIEVQTGIRVRPGSEVPWSGWMPVNNAIPTPVVAKYQTCLLYTSPSPRD